MTTLTLTRARIVLAGVSALFLLSLAAAPAGAATCAGATVTILGTNNPDLIYGTSGSDVISSLDGGDEVHGGGGNDIICTGPGNDTASGDAGVDSIFGGSGGDFLRGGSGDDYIDGGIDGDTLWADANCATILGGPGNDTLNLGGCEGRRGDGGLGTDTCSNFYVIEFNGRYLMAPVSCEYWYNYTVLYE